LNIRRFSENFSDVSAFGAQFLRRHLPRITSAETACVKIPKFGPIHLRAGESDVLVVRQVFRSRGYDTDTFPAVGSRIQRRYEEIIGLGKTPTIVDAGANIGAASLWFRKRYPQAAIVAVEPKPGNLSVLKKNAYGRPQITVLAAAIGSYEGFVSVKNNGLGWAAQTERADNGIPVVTMRAAFDSVKNSCPFIAKIDIEGFESDLFSHNIDWLNDVYVLFIEPHDWMLPGKMTSHSFQKALGQHSFELFVGGDTLKYVRT